MQIQGCRSKIVILFSVFLAVISCLWGYFFITLSNFENITVNIGDLIRPEVLIGSKFLNSGSMKQSLTLEPENPSLQLKVFGVIPLKKLAVNVISQVKVFPGGQSIGIVINSKGIMVVGMSDITDEQGKKVNPAEDAGIKVGDVILSVNGKKIINEYQLKSAIRDYGMEHRKVVLEIKRGPRVFKTTVNAIVCNETGNFRIGLFVRDNATGVGTLSFYHPESRKFGALGHIIADVDTAKGIDLHSGNIFEASIRGIHRGKKGNPGEKVGVFLEDGYINGNIEKNSRYGIYGTLTKAPENQTFDKPIPVALSYQIEKGPAEILTVLEGTEIKKYSVEIEEVYLPWNSQGKGMIIKVTDPELIRITGGIIQGMSGSPILQNGMLIGVVTHVFINDPLRGYGVPAEWMIKDAGLISSDKLHQNAS